jgi:hypothetical protein
LGLILLYFVSNFVFSSNFDEHIDIVDIKNDRVRVIYEKEDQCKYYIDLDQNKLESSTEMLKKWITEVKSKCTK